MICSAPGCDRATVAKGLCLMHYKRARAGKPLVRAEPEVGSLDGHGRYGMLDEDEAGLLCHECGRRYVSLGAHIGRAHEMTAREYKIAHGLPLMRGLVSRDLRQARSDQAIARIGSPAWRRLEATRDPAAASAARDEISLSYRGITLVEAAERARIAGQATRVMYECVVCGRRWTSRQAPAALTCSRECRRAWLSARPGPPRPRNAARDARIRALSRSGWSRREIAAEYGITTVRVGQIVRDAQSRHSSR